MAASASLAVILAFDCHTPVHKSAASCSSSTLPYMCTGLSLGDHELKHMRMGRTLQQIPTDPTQLAAYIFNLLSSGNTPSAATAIAQAATQGSSGANAIATAIATASSTVCTYVSHCFFCIDLPGICYEITC